MISRLFVIDVHKQEFEELLKNRSEKYLLELQSKIKNNQLGYILSNLE